MSMPFEIVYCETCEERWSSFFLWGKFLYCLPDGREIPVHLDWGWCNRCGCFGPVEHLRPYEQYDVELGKIRAHLRKTRLRLWPTIMKVCLFFLRKKDIETWNNLSEQITGGKLDRDRLIEEKQVAALRTEPLKCMLCGSEEVSCYDWPPFPPFEDNVLPVPTGYTHPGCGGKLWLTTSGSFRIRIILERRLYDINGNLLKRERM